VPRRGRRGWDAKEPVSGGGRRACEERKGGRMQARERGSGGESPWILLGEEGEMGNGDLDDLSEGFRGLSVVCLVYNTTVAVNLPRLKRISDQTYKCKLS
jgi:hypothetical protein